MTLLLSYKSLHKTYGDVPIFDDLSFNLKAGEKRGLIGGNGSGKSTLLKLIAGEDVPDRGEKYIKPLTRMAYLPQEDILDGDKTIEQTLFDALSQEPVDDPERYRRVKRATGLGEFPDETQKCRDLSGGWRKRLAITRALILEPDLLLLDEPTNHLDIKSILWLENILKKPPFAFVVVSHDRCFLENVCSDIMELGRCYPDGHLSVSGGYMTFRDQRENFLEAQSRQETILSNKMRRETEWLSRGAKARSTKARYRIDQAEELRAELAMVKRMNLRTRRLDIDFDSTQRKTRQLMTCRNMGKSIQGRTLFQDITLKLTPGTRLGLMGNNGSGKTTFMNILENKTAPDTGSLQRVDNLKVAVFDQTRSRLDPETSLKEALSPAGDAVMFQNRSIHIVSWAKRFLFTPDQLTLPVKRLSGGEKARILIANLMVQPADILLLDEPTNDLDIPSLEVLEESLMDFPGAVVIVSHDRFLLDRVTDTILFLDGKGGANLFADYNQCLKQQIKPLATPQEKQAPRSRKGPDSPPKQGTGFSYKHQYELDQMEEKILMAEAKVTKIQETAEAPETMKDPEALAKAYTNLQKAQETVDSLYARWETLENLKSQS